MKKSHIVTNTKGKLDIHIKESFGWKMVDATAATEGEVRGPFKKVHNTYTTKYEFNRCSGYEKNIIFKFTEMLANLFLVVRSTLEDLFTYNLILKIVGLILLIVAWPISLILYGGTYFLCFLGKVERKLLRLDETFSENESISPIVSVKGHESKTVVSCSNRKLKELEAFGWKTQGYIDVNAASFNVTHSKNKAVLNEIKKDIKKGKYDSSKEDRIDKNVYQRNGLLRRIDVFIRSFDVRDKLSNVERHFHIAEKVERFSLFFVILFILLDFTFLSIYEFDFVNKDLLVIHIFLGVFILFYLGSIVDKIDLCHKARKTISQDIKKEEDKKERDYEGVFKILKYVLLAPYNLVKLIFNGVASMFKSSSGVLKTVLKVLVIGWASLSLIVSSVFCISYFIGWERQPEVNDPSTIVVKRRVKVIAEEAYKNNKDVVNLYLPESLEKIGADAFLGCEYLDSVYYDGSIEDWCNIEFVNASSNPMIEGIHFYIKDGKEYVEVKEINIPKGVKNIGNYQFFNFDCLEKITFHSGLESINEGAFSGCDEIEEINIPSNVKSIADSAFSSCESINKITFESNSNLTDLGDYAFARCSINEINLPDKLKTIGVGTFYECPNLNSITLPNSLREIKENAFIDVPLTNIYFKGSIADWCKITFVNEYANPMYTGKNFNISNNGEFIETKVIDIPNSVTNIGDYQFISFDNITNVSIPNSVTNIGISAFAGCEAIETITIPFVGEKSDYSGDLQFNYLFNGIVPSLLKEVTITSGTIVYPQSFLGCESIEKVNLPNTIKEIKFEAFAECFNLKSINIPSGVTNIWGKAFYRCISLEKFILPIDSKLNSIGDRAFEGCSFNEFVLPKALVSIGESPFSQMEKVYYNGTINDWFNIHFDRFNSNPMGFSEKFYLLNENNEYAELTSVKVPENITEIGKYQFYGLDTLISVDFNNVYRISEGAFKSCKELKDIEFGNVGYIDKEAFSSCVSLKDINFAGVYSIGESAFNGCVSLEKVLIGKNLDIIGEKAFYDCKGLRFVQNLSSLNIKKESSDYGYVGYYARLVCPFELSSALVIDNFYFYENTKGTYLFYYDGTDKEITLPTGFEYSIAEDAFKDKKIIEKVVIPNNVNSIEAGAFQGCSNLVDLTMGTKIAFMGESAFLYCSSFQNVYYDGSIEDWCKIEFTGRYANPMSYARNFYYKDNEYKLLTELVIPTTVTDIGAYQFCDFNCLMSVVLHENVNQILTDAFRFCSNLLVIYNLSYLDIIKKSDTNGSIAYYAEVIEKNLNGHIIELDGYYFYENEEEAILLKYKGENTEIVVPADFNGKSYRIAYAAFQSNKIITKITFPDTMLEIPDYLLSNCTALKTIVLPENVEKIGIGAFQGCSALESITIPFVGNYIGQTTPYFSSIFGATNKENSYKYVPLSLKEVIVNYTQVPANSFAYCENIESIVLHPDTNYIGSGAFYGCSALKSIIIPENVEKIDSNTFTGCRVLESIIFMSNEKLLEIGYKAFSECYALEEFIIPDSVNTIGSYAFSNCRNLIHVQLPSSTTLVGKYAFSACAKLKTIVIPNSITKVEDWAFSECNALETVYYIGEKSNWNSIIIRTGNTPLNSADIYYYADEKSDGNYWHYDENDKPVIWE